MDDYTDYTSFLRVTEDGHIWWVLEEAYRLGAGYLPVRIDHNMLVAKLRPPNDRVLVNERTLLGAFWDDRLTIKRPRLVERDGFRHVDAEEFLDWLLQYISQTQADIAFPNELASEVRMIKAKAAASQSPIASQEFESLTLALEDWFDKDLDDLPIALRHRVERAFSPFFWWDEMSADQRRNRAREWDYQHDPATEQERQYWETFGYHIGEVKADIAKWQSVATPTASDLALKESRLKELEQELKQMESQKQLLRGECPLPESLEPTQNGVNKKPAPTVSETPPEMFKRLKETVADDKVIAHKIKKAFPQLSDANLGALYYLPGERVTHGAKRKKGQRLLGKIK